MTTFDTTPAPRISGFELGDRLGEGGMGVVYKARQVAMDRWVAVKILRDELAQEPEYIRRFLKEARLAGRLRHANIVSALDCGDAGGRYFMVMEFVDGTSLHQHLRRRGVLPEAEALDIARGIAEGLQYAWAHKIIHRDLKPQNVLLAADGTPKISDFGLCRDVRDLPHLTSLGLIHCTPEYASPEQARGDKDIDGRSDLYSLGVTMYEMLTGVLPFEAADAATMIVKHAMDQVRPPIERNRAISPATNRLVLDLLEKAREERPASPALVIERIRAIGAPSRSRETGTSRRSNTRAWRTNRRAASAKQGQPLAVVALLSAVIILVAVVLLSRPTPKPPDPPPARPHPAPVEPPEMSSEELRKSNLSRFLRSYECGPEGGVNHWLVLGPLRLDSPVTPQAEIDFPVPGLEFARGDGSMVRWMRTENAGGVIDFSQVEGWRDEGEYAALAACWVECLADVSADIRFATTGGYELQLDRRVLASGKKGADPLRQKMVLGKGWHSLLVKLERHDSRLTIQLRLVTPDGHRLPSVRIWQ